MKYRFEYSAYLVCTFMSLAFTPVSVVAEEIAEANNGSGWESPAAWFVYTVIFIVLIGSLATLLVIRTALHNSKWSIADALSEEAEISATKTDASGVTTAIYDDSKKPMMITEMRASASRMIALLGTIVILLMFLGFGAFALYAFAMTGEMPDSIDQVVNFLVAGLTLFAPYVVNKFSSIFERFIPKKT